jgi:hypothetical protein
MTPGVCLSVWGRGGEADDDHSSNTEVGIGVEFGNVGRDAVELVGT